MNIRRKSCQNVNKNAVITSYKMKGIYSTKKINHRTEALVTIQKNTAFALTRDNTKLHYTLHSGEKRGCPRIVLVHSLAMDGEFWNPVVPPVGPQV